MNMNCIITADLEVPANAARYNGVYPSFLLYKLCTLSMILVQRSLNVHKNEVRHAWLQVFRKEPETKLTTYVLFRKFTENFPLQYSKLYSYLSPMCPSTPEEHHLAVNGI